MLTPSLYTLDKKTMILYLICFVIICICAFIKKIISDKKKENNINEILNK